MEGGNAGYSGNIRNNFTILNINELDCGVRGLIVIVIERGANVKFSFNTRNETQSQGQQVRRAPFGLSFTRPI